jgi:hypothetical protein
MAWRQTKQVLRSAIPIEKSLRPATRGSSRAGDFAPAEEDPSKSPTFCSIDEFLQAPSRVMDELHYASGDEHFATARSTSSQPSSPDWLELAGRTLRKAAEDIGSADAERYQQTSERGWCQLESGSSFECRRGQAGPEAERTGSELAMTRLVASPRREVLCPVRQSFSPGCAAEDLHQTALCDHLRRTRARRSNRELSSG